MASSGAKKPCLKTKMGKARSLAEYGQTVTQARCGAPRIPCYTSP
jgi:hypothetical protein